MSRTDVIVLGGGIIGASLAEELSRRGRRVTLIERGRIGAEASSAAAGILAAHMDVPRPGSFFELCQAARHLYPAWVARLERSSGLQVEFHKNGILYLAETAREEAAMFRQARWQRRRGLRVERWTMAKVRREEPTVHGKFRCGFAFPDEAQVDNVMLMEALALACRKAGVTLMERTLVRKLLVRGRRVEGVRTDRRMLRAPVVVNCLGSWANMDGTFPVRIPVEPARGQMLAFEAPKRLVRRSVISARAYMVQRRDGRLLVGSTIERAGFEKFLTLEGMAGILHGVRAMSRALDQATFLDAWAGFRPATPDGLPILGPTGIDGLFVATGHFRHGILLAPITAQLIAELIVSGRPLVSFNAFSASRFQS